VKIQLVSQFFDPEPTLKGMVFAGGLRDRGHDVRVLTGFPNYPSGEVADGYTLRPHQREVLDGVVVDRMWLYPSHDRSVVRRAGNYASWAASSSARVLVDRWRPDVVWAHHPPLTALSAALLQSALRRPPLAIEIQDLWPQSLSSTGMVSGSMPLRAVGAGMQAAYRRADRIICISPGFKGAIAGTGIPESKLDVIRNWADESRLAPTADDRAWAAAQVDSERFNLAFTGNMGPAQALPALLDALAIALPDAPLTTLHMVGDGLDLADLQHRAASLPQGSVVFHGRQPMGRTAALAQACDVGVVHLKDDPLFDITIPSKTQAYLHLGVPVLMAARGDAADLVRCAGAGVVASPGSAAHVAQAIVALAHARRGELRVVGERGRTFYRQQLSVSSGLDRYEHLFDGLTAGRARDAH
jgi:glycosyltransferase involved in cell wall biosynthesis